MHSNNYYDGKAIINILLHAQNMKLEILTNIPESGSIDEVRFDAFGDCTWVKFVDADCIEWVGVFGQGWGGGVDACQNSSGAAFVLSGGQGYVVDINSRKLISKTECDYLKKVISCDEENIFVAATDTDLRVYSDAELIFSTERIASDGVNLSTFNNGVLAGEVWGFDKWYPFTFDTTKRTYKCDWVCPL